MSGKSKPSNPASLIDIEASVAAVDQISAMQHRLRQAAFDAIREDQISSIMQKQIEKALSGDATAAQFVMKFAAGLGNPTTIKQTNILCTDVETAARLSKNVKF